MIQIKVRRRWGRHLEGVRHFIFRCPVTGLNVQGTQLGAESEQGPYTSQKCLACGGVHLVNSQSGKLMSEERPPPRPDPARRV